MGACICDFYGRARGGWHLCVGQHHDGVGPSTGWRCERNWLHVRACDSCRGGAGIDREALRWFGRNADECDVLGDAAGAEELRARRDWRNGIVGRGYGFVGFEGAAAGGFISKLAGTVQRSGTGVWVGRVYDVLG